MTNIYDKANEFERALRESEEYKASISASEALYADAEAKELYTEFVATQKKLMEGAQTGEQPSEEELKSFEEIQQKLMGNTKFLEFVQVQQKLQFLIEDLNKIMYKPLDELFEKYGNQ
ncbi:YlbF family regulator [Gemella cuniculi]|uniref:YlbF family regulator n=1 Tax=Gemella cuniculi TaxID=150240 RepID=UPI000401E449|nr:YlbF family regulator [Gemella cuniculi]